MTDPGRPRAPELPPGHRLGHYEILGVLGVGGMGQVYRARDLKLERTVALKCPHRDLAVDPAFRRRFLREARAASAVSHPNIVQVFDVIEAEGLPWTVMEFIAGPTLRSLLHGGRPMPFEDVVRHAEGLAAGLDAAHRHGIMHRDIKPSNVLVDRDGRPRLTDFGLAKYFSTDSSPDSATTMTVDETRPGAAVGTRGYMAPEQALGRPIDQRADIFSLGAVLYEMCAGRPAFAASGEGDTLDAVLHRDPVALAGLNDEVPAEFARIVGKCLAKRPEERYQSAADLLSDIRVLRRRLESGASDVVEGDHRWRRWLRSRAFQVLAAVAVTAAAGTIAYWVIRPGPGEMRVPVVIPRQLTSGPGWEADPAVSPDGDFVAYAASDGGMQADIYLVDARGGEPLRLTDDPAADTNPAWFPDGSALAFVSARGGGPSVWKVPRLGGSAIQILPNANDPAISPDGRMIAFSRRTAAGDGRVYVAPLGDPDRAMALTGDGDGLWDHAHPAWSHDGRTICYETWAGLWLVPAAGGKARRLTSESMGGRTPAWSADDRFIYFTSPYGETEALWRVAVASGATQRLTLGTGPEGQPTIARNGSLLAYSTYVDTRTIVVLDRGTGSRARLENLSVAFSPSFAADTSAVFFSSDKWRKADLWVQPLAEGRPRGSPRQLTDLPGGVATLSVSPDGRWVAFHRVLEHQRDIWIVAVDGGPAVNFTNDPGVDVQPAWSPDAGRIAFSSDRDGRQHIWVAPAREGRPAGPATQVTTGDSLDLFPAWSPDGRQIAFLRAVGSTSDIYVVTPDGGVPRQVTHGASPGGVAWEGRGDSLLVSGSWGTGRMEMRRVRLSGGDPEPLDPQVVFGNDSALGDFCLSRDGRYIAYVEETRRGDIWVLQSDEGWR